MSATWTLPKAITSADATSASGDGGSQTPGRCRRPGWRTRAQSARRSRRTRGRAGRRRPPPGAARHTHRGRRSQRPSAYSRISGFLDPLRPGRIAGVPSAGGITRVFPDLSEDLLLNLFHKGARAQWTSRDLDWGVGTRLDGPPAAGSGAAAHAGVFRRTNGDGRRQQHPAEGDGRRRDDGAAVPGLVHHGRGAPLRDAHPSVPGARPRSARDCARSRSCCATTTAFARATAPTGCGASCSATSSPNTSIARSAPARCRRPAVWQSVDAHSAGRVAPPGVRRALPAAQRGDDGAGAAHGRWSTCATTCFASCRR